METLQIHGITHARFMLSAFEETDDKPRRINPADPILKNTLFYFFFFLYRTFGIQ